MWLITIEAIPDSKRNSEAAKQFGGAYVNCWVDFQLGDGATELAKFYVRNEGWNFIKFDEENAWFQDKEDCENSEQLQYFSEAVEFGICMVWYSYPLEAEDSDEDFELENSTNTSKNIKTEH